jgi:hypothetical protein
MPRFRPLAIACAKLAVVLLFLIAFTTVGASVRAAPGGNADLSITGSASSTGVKVGHDVAWPPERPVDRGLRKGSLPRTGRRRPSELSLNTETIRRGMPRGYGDGG